MVKSLTAAKSVASVPAAAAADTVTVTADSKVLPSGTVAVARAAVAGADSAKPVWVPAVASSASTLRAMAGGASSSSMVSREPMTVNPEAVPETIRSSSPSTRWSSAVVKTKVPVAMLWLAGMVMVKSETAVKSSASAARVPPAAATEMVMTASALRTTPVTA